MGWAKFDDRWHTNPKILKLSLDAVGLDCLGINWACCNESDGFLDLSIVRHLAAVRNWKKITDSLVAVGRWVEDAERGGYWIHDFLEYNYSHQELEEKRASDRSRKAKQKRDSVSGKFRVESERNPDGIQTESAGIHTVPDPTRPGLKIKEVFKGSKDPLNPSWRTQGKLDGFDNPSEEANGESLENSRTAEASGETAIAKTPKPKKRDPLFEAIAEVCSIGWACITEMERGTVRTSRNQLAKTPNGTPEEVYRKAPIYHRMFPNAMLTPMALVKYWSRLEEENIPKTKAQLNAEDFERTFERLTGGTPVDVFTVGGGLGRDNHMGGIAPNPLTVDNHVSAARDRAQVAERVESATPFTLAIDTHEAQNGDSVASNGAEHGFCGPAYGNPPNRSTEPLVGKPVYIPVTNPPNGSLAFQHGVDPYDRPAPESNEAAAPRSQANAGNAAKSAIAGLAKRLSGIESGAPGRENSAPEPDCFELYDEPEWSDAEIASHEEDLENW